MARDKLGLVDQPDAALLLQHAQCGDRISHDRGLSVFGEHELIVRTLGHQPVEILSERIVHLLKYLARGEARIRKGFPHADGLAALPRKDICAHVRSSCNTVRVDACSGRTAP
jgi:hypothetical protein